MTVLDTFYLLFKSNSSDVVKGNKAVVKSNKEVTASFKEANQESQNLGKSYVKTVDAIASGITAAVSYGTLKSGIVDATKMNSSLYTMSKITNQNINQLQYLSNAAERAGGSVQGALGDINQFVNNAAQRGVAPGSFADFLKTLRGQTKGERPEIALQKITQAGVSDTGLQYLLMSNDEEWNKFFDNAKKYSTITETMGKNAHDLAAAYKDMRMSQSAFWSTVSDTIGPTAAKGLMSAADAIGGVAGSVNGSMLAAGGIGAASIYSSLRTMRALRGLAGLGGAAAGSTAAAAPGSVAAAEAAWASATGGGGAVAGGAGAATVGGLAAGGLAAGALIYYHKNVANWLDNQMFGNTYARARASFGGGKSGAIDGGAMSFWMSKGFSKEEAAAIVANEMHESGGNPEARGDGGNAHGLYQVQNTRGNKYRRDRIKAGTGIDISSAGANDQREAIWWDMQHGGEGFDVNTFKNLDGAAAKAAYFSQKFLYPADATGQAMARAKTALGLAGGFSGNSGGGSGTSVNIQNIEIKTNATDADGIAKSLNQSLSSVLRSLQGNYDDSVRA